MRPPACFLIRSDKVAVICPRCPQVTAADSWAGCRGYDIVHELGPQHEQPIIVQQWINRRPESRVNQRGRQ